MTYTEAHGIRQYFTASEAPWQNGHVERHGGVWKAAARKAVKDVGPRGFVEMRKLASMVNWAKNARINSSGYSPAPMGHPVKDTNCRGHFCAKIKASNWASLELPDHSTEFGRRMSWLWAARRAFEIMDTSHRLRTGLCFAKSQEKTEPTRRRHVLPIGEVVQQMLLAKRRTTCSCLHRGCVTNVAPECLRKASVAEQMSWDTTTKGNALFESALD